MRWPRSYPFSFKHSTLVCFPAMPGTPFSVVLQAMAYGVPCVAMTKYGMPPEVSGAGVRVECQWDNFGNFHVPMHELSATINADWSLLTCVPAFEGVARKFPAEVYVAEDRSETHPTL